MPDPRQKKLQKHKKKRASAHHSGSQTSAGEQRYIQQAQRSLANAAPTWPAGPCWVPVRWDDQNTKRFFPVAACRHPQPGSTVACVYLLDLGCRGLVDAFVSRPYEDKHIGEFLNEISRAAHSDLGQVKMPVVSTIVRRAMQYAEKLGFEPPENLRHLIAFLGDEWLTDLSVPFGRNNKPLYEPEEGDDTRPIVQKLVKAVGPDGFNVILPNRAAPDSAPEN